MFNHYTETIIALWWCGLGIDPQIYFDPQKNISATGGEIAMKCGVNVHGLAIGFGYSRHFH